MEFEGKLTITQALEALDGININITRPTLIKWCQEHGLGIQLGSPKGHWWVDMKKLKDFVTEGTCNNKEEGGG